MITYEEKLNRDTAWALLEGSMHFEEKSAVHETLRNLTQSLNELGVDYAVAGGMAMFLHGFRRFTEDVDVLVTQESLAAIHAALEGRGYVKPFTASKNLRDTRTGVKIDFLISGQFPGDGKPGPIAFPHPANVSKESDGMRVVELTPLIELKLASGRAPHRGKDLDDVQSLIQALSLPRGLAERLDPSVRDAYLLKWEHAQRAAADDY
jgi:aminoglycoside-2''-adenylyltransferase